MAHFVQEDKKLRAQGFDLIDIQTVVLSEGSRHYAAWESRIGLLDWPSIAGWEYLDAARQVAERKQRVGPWSLCMGS